MAKDTFRIEGLPALKRKLSRVSTETAGKTGFSALRKAAKDVVAADAKGRARRFDDPETSESIADAIVIRRDNKHFKRTGRQKVSVGVRVTGANPVFYWRFRELGTENEPARPFMRPALETNTREATAAFIRDYNRKLDRILRKESAR